MTEPVAGPSRRRSLIAIHNDISNNSSAESIPSIFRGQNQAIRQKLEREFEENDDEAERCARRVQNAPKPSRHETSLNSMSFTGLSVNEIHSQIAQCLKLNAENKINEKNAFQLRMIDFLIFSLKKQDVTMTNLQMASACLDASGKIYGYRVDKVHSDLLKVVGHAEKGEKRRANDSDNNEDNEQQNVNNNGNHPRKRRKRIQHDILSTVESLKGKLDTYDPISLMNCKNDVQTSDMLFQASLPQHVNQGVAVNLYNDVLLDRIPSNATKSSKIIIRPVDDFTADLLCPSYASFMFLGWSPDDEFEKNPEPMCDEEEDGEYHFNLDGSVSDDDCHKNDIMMDCGDVLEKSCQEHAQSSQHHENIVDFQDVIANDPDPNVEYEYSYMKLNHRIDWAGPSHWKIKFNSNAHEVVKSCKHTVRRKKKDIELSFTADSKKVSESRFIQRESHLRITSMTANNWSEDKLVIPLDTSHDPKRFYNYIIKPMTDRDKFSDNERIEEQHANESQENFDDFNNSLVNNNPCNVDNGVNIPDNVDNYEGDNLDEAFAQENEAAIVQSQEAFVGNNLVLVPAMVQKIFVPYSQRAKRIDMHSLKTATWKCLRRAGDQNGDSMPISFSSIYLQLPTRLSKANSESLSTALAFVSLMHVAHERNLLISNQSNDLCDITISNIQGR